MQSASERRGGWQAAQHRGSTAGVVVAGERSPAENPEIDSVVTAAAEVLGVDANYAIEAFGAYFAKVSMRAGPAGSD